MSIQHFLRLPSELLKTIKSSWEFFRHHPLIQDMTTLDFVFSFFSWTSYLVYTIFRITILGIRYFIMDDKTVTFRQAQVFTTANALGILTCQIYLLSTDATSIWWSLLVFLWVGVVLTISSLAREYARTSGS